MALKQLPQGFLTGIGTLVGAGIGFGSQEIFRDIFKGTVHLTEKLFSVGDTVTVNSDGGAFTGTVEKVTLRHIGVRTEENLTYVPQGMISVIENYSAGNGSFILQLPFNTDVEIEHIVESIQRYMDDDSSDMSRWINSDEEKAMNSILSTNLLGVSSVSHGEITYSISGTTEPGKQFKAKRALLKYISMRLNEDGIQFSTSPMIGGK